MEHDILIKLLIASVAAKGKTENFPWDIFMNNQPNRILHFTVI